ncbi:MAG: hypothetical protein AB7N80_09115 [Bdellovibrionales bacterium]
MRFMILTLVTTLFTAAPLASAKVKKSKSTPTQQYLLTWMRYLNSFANFGELLEQYERMGILLPAENQEILGELKKQGISAQDRIPRFRVKKEAFMVANISWTPMKDSLYKCQQGRLLKLKNQTQATQIFKLAQDCFKESSQASLFQFFLASAEAADAKAPAAGALALLGDFVVRAAFGDLIMPLATHSPAAASWVIENVYWRHWAKEGKVRCRNGDFVMENLLREPTSVTQEQKTKNAQACRAGLNEVGADAAFDSGHFQGLCEYRRRLMDYSKNVLDRHTRAYIVPEDKVTLVFGQNIKCITEQQATLMENALKGELQSIRASYGLYDAERHTSSGATH